MPMDDMPGLNWDAGAFVLRSMRPLHCCRRLDFWRWLSVEDGRYDPMFVSLKYLGKAYS